MRRGVGVGNTSDTVPRDRGTVTTILGGLTLDGLVATMTIEGGTDGDVFAVFLDEVLGPHIKDGDLVVMDNARAHKDQRVKTTLAPYGSKAVYRPPYSPELNPIELAWSKLKGFFRTTKAWEPPRPRRLEWTRRSSRHELPKILLSLPVSG